MVDPNWGLLQGNNQFMNNFQMGVSLGDRVATSGRANALDNALASYAKDPSQQNLSMVIDRDPRMGMQLQEREAQRKAAEAKARQEKAMQVAKLFDGVTPENYQQLLSVAQRMGIDTTGAPQQFDPAWVAENGAIMKFVAEKPEALSDAGRKAVDKGFTPGTIEFQNDVKTTLLAEATKPIPYQPGGGVATYNAQTGQTQVIVQPNYGDQPAGAPAQPSGNIARPKTKAERDALKPGQQYEAPDGSIRTVPGGASSNTGGSFRGTEINPISDLGQYGLKPTSGFRTQQHQDALRAAGKTKTKTGSHPRGDALDFDVPAGMTKQQAIALVQQKYPGARAIPSNGNSIHVTFPGWGRAPDVSGSRRRYGS